MKPSHRQRVSLTRDAALSTGIDCFDDGAGRLPVVHRGPHVDRGMLASSHE